MTRVFKILFIIFITAGISACASAPDAPTPSIPERTSFIAPQTLHDDLRPVEVTGPNWLSLGGGTWDYIVYDNEGNEFFRDMGTPGYTMLGENLLRTVKNGGGSLRITRFFDVEQRIVSPEYYNVFATEYGLVTYIDESKEENSVIISALVVHDLFDPDSNRNVFWRDFEIVFSIGVEFIAIEFLDEYHLYIEYHNSQDELVKETLELK